MYFLIPNINPMTLYKEITSYFNKWMLIYGSNLSILWSLWKIRIPYNLKIANFGHPASKYWQRLRPCTLATQNNCARGLCPNASPCDVPCDVSTYLYEYVIILHNQWSCTDWPRCGIEGRVLRVGLGLRFVVVCTWKIWDTTQLFLIDWALKRNE